MGKTITDTKKLRNGFIAGLVALNLGLTGCATSESSKSNDPENQTEWVKTHTKRIESIDKSTTSEPMNYVYTYKTEDRSLKQSTIKSYWDEYMLGEFDSANTTVREDANTENSRIEIYRCDYTDASEALQRKKKRDSAHPLDFLFEESAKCVLPTGESGNNKLEIHVPKGTLKDLKNSSKEHQDI